MQVYSVHKLSVMLRRDGGVIEIRQPHIEESSFHASSLTGEDGRPPVQAVVRYWSDYAKLYLLPRSLHQLPDHPTRETAQSSWTASQNEYNVFNEVCFGQSSSGAGLTKELNT